MSHSEEVSIVLGFPGHTVQAREFAEAAGTDYADIDIHYFPDGESRVRLPPALPRHAVLFCSLSAANRQLVELELAAATALELGATELTLVAPYLCYMRQDVAFSPGEAVSQRVIGALLARRFTNVITVDPHLHRTPTLVAAVPARRAIALSAAPVMSAWLEQRGDSPLLIGPDAESAQWVRAIAAPAGLDFGIATKVRRGDADVRIRLPDLSVRSRPVVLVDDVASTGQTLLEAARQITDCGAASVSVLVTHALFVGSALDRLAAAGVTDVCSTDSIPHPTNRLHLAALLANALARTQALSHNPV